MARSQAFDRGSGACFSEKILKIVQFGAFWRIFC